MYVASFINKTASQFLMLKVLLQDAQSQWYTVEYAFYSAGYLKYLVYVFLSDSTIRMHAPLQINGRHFSWSVPSLQLSILDTELLENIYLCKC